MLEKYIDLKIAETIIPKSVLKESKIEESKSMLIQVVLKPCQRVLRSLKPESYLHTSVCYNTI
jgi:hypothetical protein